MSQFFQTDLISSKQTLKSKKSTKKPLDPQKLSLFELEDDLDDIITSPDNNMKNFNKKLEIFLKQFPIKNKEKSKEKNKKQKPNFVSNFLKLLQNFDKELKIFGKSNQKKLKEAIKIYNISEEETVKETTENVQKEKIVEKENKKFKNHNAEINFLLKNINKENINKEKFQNKLFSILEDFKLEKEVEISEILIYKCFPFILDYSQLKDICNYFVNNTNKKNIWEKILLELNFYTGIFVETENPNYKIFSLINSVKTQSDYLLCKEYFIKSFCTHKVINNINNIKNNTLNENDILLETENLTKTFIDEFNYKFESIFSLLRLSFVNKDFVFCLFLLKVLAEKSFFNENFVFRSQLRKIFGVLCVFVANFNNIEFNNNNKNEEEKYFKFNFEDNFFITKMIEVFVGRSDNKKLEFLSFDFKSVEENFIGLESEMFDEEIRRAFYLKRRGCETELRRVLQQLTNN